MRVGILGSAQVGQTLAKGFSAKGFDVMVGTRDPAAKSAELRKAVPKAKVGTFADAARHGEVCVLAVHGKNVEEAVRMAGPDNLAGKLVLDTSNPLDFGPNGAHFPANIKDSCLQTAQRAAPKAHLVKAWNCTPGGLMVDPPHAGDQFICGNDAQAKDRAAAILKAFGWRVADVGDATMAPYVEGMALAAINWAVKANDWGWVLQLNGRTK
jgi:8-hydroxy-5-deazaflavin:NADPH oxidoreductase